MVNSDRSGCWNGVAWQPNSLASGACPHGPAGPATAAGTGRVTLVGMENGGQSPRGGTLVSDGGGAWGRVVDVSVAKPAR